MPALDKNQEMRNDYLLLTAGLQRRWWYGRGKMNRIYAECIGEIPR